MHSAHAAVAPRCNTRCDLPRTRACKCAGSSDRTLASELCVEGLRFPRLTLHAILARARHPRQAHCAQRTAHACMARPGGRQVPGSWLHKEPIQHSPRRRRSSYDRISCAHSLARLGSVAVTERRGPVHQHAKNSFPRWLRRSSPDDHARRAGAVWHVLRGGGSGQHS